MKIKKNPRLIAFEVICLVVLKKSSIPNIEFECDDKNLGFIKSLIFGTIRFYHQLNDVVNTLIKKNIAKDDIDLHCLILLGAYQLLYTNQKNYAVINESVEITKIINKEWVKGFCKCNFKKNRYK